MRVFMVMILVTAGLACGQPGNNDVKYEVIANGFAAVDLISPATCQLQNSRLRQCTIASIQHDPPMMDTAVPLRTVINRQTSGNCSTQFPLAVVFAIDGAPAVNLPFLSQSHLVLRRTDGGVVSHVTMDDASPWTSTAVFADTCRVSITITSNDIDVDTTQQAEAVLAVIDHDLSSAQLDVRNYRTLLALQAAYHFTLSIVTSFHEELTNDTMQALRQAALDSASAMQTVILGCGDALSEDQRNTLFNLYVSMVVLGDPSTWRNPDGSTKTLEQFYGPGAAEVLAQLQALANQANPDLETEFRNGLEAASAEFVRLQQKRALAVQQLAPWLGGTP